MGPAGLVLLLVLLVEGCAAEDASNCYTSGGVAGIVVATAVVTAVLIALVLGALWYLRRRRKGFRTDNILNGNAPKTAGSGDGKYAYDNPYFRDEESAVDTTDKGRAPNASSESPQQSATLPKTNGTTKTTWMPWTSKAIPFSGVFTQAKRHRTMDDSCLPMEPERIIVPLRGHDFTGLGFNICGNMRDGIFVKDVLNRGPANESGIVKAGDRIASVTVSFNNMVYEDALTILSYASPYDVKLEIVKPGEKRSGFPSVTSSGKLSLASRTSGKSQRLFHPLYRSQSIDDLTQIGKDGTATPTQSSVQPKRSQSIGVATQLMKSSPRSVDIGGGDCYGSPKKARAASSTTGSLNEKVLTTAMHDSSHAKPVVVPESVRKEDITVQTSAQVEDTEDKVIDAGDVTVTRAKEAPRAKESVETEVEEPVITPTRKPVSTPNKRKAPAPPTPNNSIKTTAQVHRIDEKRVCTDDGERDRARSSSSSSCSSRGDDKPTSNVTTVSLTAAPPDDDTGKESNNEVPGTTGEEYDSAASQFSDDHSETARGNETPTKRKASSTGDLTAIEDVSKKSPTVLERAVSLDFKSGVLPEGNLNFQKCIMKKDEALFPGYQRLNGTGRAKTLTEESSLSDSESDDDKRNGHYERIYGETPSGEDVSYGSSISPVTMKSLSTVEMPKDTVSPGSLPRTIFIRETVVVETKPRPTSRLSSEDVAIITPEPESPERVVSPSFSFEMEQSSLNPNMSSGIFSYSPDDDDKKETTPIVTSTPAHRVITVESIRIPKEQNAESFLESSSDKEVIEITKRELDNVMLSHKDFLLKTAQATGMYSGLSKTDSGGEADSIKFESWHYTDADNGSPTNGTNGNSRSSLSHYKTAVEGSTSGISLGSTPQKIIFPDVTGYSTRVSEGPLTTTVLISTTDPSTLQMHASETTDSPPPELYRPI
ncbi:uncharacterized protein LOC135401324 [Ornithodoros turicata]